MNSFLQIAGFIFIHETLTTFCALLGGPVVVEGLRLRWVMVRILWATAPHGGIVGGATSALGDFFVLLLKDGG